MPANLQERRNRRPFPRKGDKFQKWEKEKNKKRAGLHFIAVRLKTLLLQLYKFIYLSPPPPPLWIWGLIVPFLRSSGHIQLTKPENKYLLCNNLPTFCGTLVTKVTFFVEHWCQFLRIAFVSKLSLSLPCPVINQCCPWRVSFKNLFSFRETHPLNCD